MSVRPGLKGGLRRIQGEIKIQQTFSLKLLGTQYRDKQIGYKNLTCTYTIGKQGKQNQQRTQITPREGKQEIKTPHEGEKLINQNRSTKGGKLRLGKNKTDLRN